MRKFIQCALVLGCFSCLSFGQSLTTVTATITDPSPQAFVSGTATAEYQRPANSQGITPVINGVPIVERPNLVGMDGSGTFVINLANLALVSPAGGKWRFTLCPNASASCSVVDSAGIVGAAVNLSANLSAGVFLISVPAQPHVFRAYKDSEIITAPGVVWLDVTINVVKYIDALGIIHTLGGGVTGVTPGGGLVLTGTTVGLRTDCSPVQTLLWSGTIWGCGTVFTGTGTPGKIPKFITLSTIGDSIISELTGTVTIGGYLNISNTLTVNSTSLFLDQATFQSTGIACAILIRNVLGTLSNQLCENTTGLGFINHMPGQDGILATLNDPIFTGDPKAPTPATGDNDTSIATTAFVKAQNYSSPGTTTGVPQRVALGAPVALVANTQTIVLTESVAFPATGGPYKADSRYGAWITAGPDACAAEIIDTTNSRAFALAAQDGNGGGFIALTGSEISTASYTAGSSATFTLQIQCNVGHNVTVNSGLFTFTPAEATYLSVTPVISN